jgi:hypothetical protein
MRHRVGDYTQRGPDYGRRCLSPEEIGALVKGGPLRLTDRGTWVGKWGERKAKEGACDVMEVGETDEFACA